MWMTDGGDFELGFNLDADRIKRRPEFFRTETGLFSHLGHSSRFLCRTV